MKRLTAWRGGRRWPCSARGKRLSMSVLVAGAFLVATASCGARAPMQRAGSVDRLAVIVRVKEGATVRTGDLLASHDSTEDPVDDRLAAMIDGLVSPYALEEWLRQAWVEALDRPVSWTMVPSLEVASALGALLAREEQPRYDALRSIGVDTVLEISVTDWGIQGRRDAVGGFLRMEARLIKLSRRERVVWRSRERVDRARGGFMPRNEAYRLLEDESALEALLADLMSAAGARLARVMRVGT